VGRPSNEKTAKDSQDKHGEKTNPIVRRDNILRGSQRRKEGKEKKSPEKGFVLIVRAGK